jgi:hypothetical protein
MPVWNFYDFFEDGRSVITAELMNLPDVKDKLDSILLKLRVMELPWPRTFCKQYKLPKKAQETLLEIRVDCLNVEFRFLGCFGLHHGHLHYLRQPPSVTSSSKRE